MSDVSQELAALRSALAIRQQEEPKPAEPQAQVIDLMQALKDSLKAWEPKPLSDWADEKARGWLDSNIPGHAAATTDGYALDLAVLLRSVRAEAYLAGQRRMQERAASTAEESYPCSCDEAYTSRKLVAPDCFKHNPLDDAAAEIRALEPESMEEGK